MKGCAACTRTSADRPLQQAGEGVIGDGQGPTGRSPELAKLIVVVVIVGKCGVGELWHGWGGGQDARHVARGKGL